MTATTDVETVRYFARCGNCKTPRTIDRPAFDRFFANDAFNGDLDDQRNNWVRCSCGRALRNWTRLNAKHSDKVKCNARCTGAFRADCECSCSGRNHGSDHLS